MTRQLTNSEVTGLLAGIILIILFAGFGLFAWWAFSWSTHTLAWAIFIFGSVLGSVKVAAKR